MNVIHQGRGQIILKLDEYKNFSFKAITVNTKCYKYFYIPTLNIQKLLQQLLLKSLRMGESFALAE